MITYVTIKNKKLNEEFCSIIKELNVTEVIDFFYTLKECRKKMALRTPDVLLLGLDFSGRNSNWIKFCTEIREKYPALKILAVVTYEQYHENKKMLNHLTSGYISTDALPEVVFSAVKAMMTGKFFRYDKIGIRTKKEKPNSELLKTTYPKLLEKISRDMTEKKETGDDIPEMIETLSQFIDDTEKFRMELIKSLLSGEKDRLDDNCADEYLTLLIGNLLIKGHSNWEIADMLNVSAEIVRFYRLEMILNLRNQNSKTYTTIPKDGEMVRLTRRDGQLLHLIAAGYSSLEIAEKFFFRDIETIKTARKNLIDKLGEKNTMTMVISALRSGLIKMEDIDELLS